MFDVALEELFSPEALEFYRVHEHEPISKLLFKYANNPVQKARSLQLESRRRAKNKLPSWFDKPGIVFPPKANLEQASSEITAAYKANVVDYETSIDLTGGSGIDSWQFSLRAKTHFFVEPNEQLVQIAEHNFRALGLKNITFRNQKAEDFISHCDSVDLIFIDPSRRNATGSKVVKLEDYRPNVVSMLPELIAKAKHILVKVSPFADLKYLVNLFGNSLIEIHVVAVQNECKEVLLLISGNANEDIAIKTINFNNEKSEIFNFSWNEDFEGFIMADLLGEYLYEPNAAVLKGGAFKQISASLKIGKLDASSHLYTSKHRVENFPGKTYLIVEVCQPYKLKGSYSSASIVSRNFPDKPEKIRKRLKMKDGNEVRIFATTFNANKVFIVGKEYPNN